MWKNLRALALVGQLGLVIIGPALVGLLVGRFLSGYIGYPLLLTIGGMLLGLIGGSMQAYKMLLKK